MTKKSATPRVPKNKRSKRTSLWLDNDLRKRLDARAKATNRSLAFTIEETLQRGLGKAAKESPDAASVFG